MEETLFPSLSLGREDWESFERGIRKEWLCTNGIGGYASSTVIGANSRRYHGLLVAALKPPGKRTILLSKIEEEVLLDDRVFRISANLYPDTIFPQGYFHLHRFTAFPLPKWTYMIEDAVLHKEVFMVNGKNTTVVTYSLESGGRPALLILYPLVTCRDFHLLQRKTNWPFDLKREKTSQGLQISLQAHPDAPTLRLISGAHYQSIGRWYYNLQYVRERERGLDYEEDSFCPGYFALNLRQGEAVSLIASSEPLENIDPEVWREAEIARRRALLHPAHDLSQEAKTLFLATDAFVVRVPGDGSCGIIAGYPWFQEWGRDALVSLPGLTLVTGRFHEAREILLTFSGKLKDGLLPNYFPEDPAGRIPYNAADVSLWFFYALYKYWEYTRDRPFIEGKMLPVMKSIMDHYKRGTHFDIGMRSDGLLDAGTPETQLTWMDAIVDKWPVTPRNGTPVDLNALWYNALKIFEVFAPNTTEAARAARLAERVRENFLRRFWNDAARCLLDCAGKKRDDSIRPNQILAASLPFPLLDRERALQVVTKVWTDLVTSLGLRTLSSREARYRGVYRGSSAERDAAYHQGTVWPCLLRQYITAFVRAHEHSPWSKGIAELLLQPLFHHLRDACVGTVSEVFDGDPPHLAGGCPAEAWSVAEILRCYWEDVLEKGPGK
ncbi:MAG: glycogen debranching enzyme N-terminal domain-containing protein [Armatimonadetes bacterium]|nr:glycogen debranching enzyme N-terminal domain-containing protein [Armatimonadota bacterium]